MKQKNEVSATNSQLPKYSRDEFGDVEFSANHRVGSRSSPGESVWVGLVAKVKRCMHVWEDDAAEVKFTSGTNDCVSLEEVCRAPDIFVDPG